MRGGELDALPALAARAQTLAAESDETEIEEPITAPPSFRVEPVTAPPSFRVEPVTAPPSLRVEPVTAPPSERAAAVRDRPGIHGGVSRRSARRTGRYSRAFGPLEAKLADRQALVSLRRAFHTLKGSGRVVGATAIGDFAWCFEDLLSHVLNNTASASMAMAELVEEAAVALEPLIGEAPVTEDALTALTALAARAAALLQGTPDEVVPTAIEPTKPAELVEVEPPPVAVAPAGPIRVELPPPVVQPRCRPNPSPPNWNRVRPGDGFGTGPGLPVRSHRNSRCQRCHLAAAG